MHITPCAEVERRSLAEFKRLATLDDGSGFIKTDLQNFLDGLGDDLYRYPTVRREGHILLGVVLIGLEEDEAVEKLFSRAARDCGYYTSGLMQLGAVQETVDAAKAVMIHMMRAMTRMEAVELLDVVTKHKNSTGLPPAVTVALRMTSDLLEAAGLDAHPDDMVRVVQRYADAVMFAGDVDLMAYFLEVERYVQGREHKLRFGVWE